MTYRSFVSAGIALVCLVMSVQAGPTGDVKWAERRQVYSISGNLSFRSTWNPETGLRLQLASHDRSKVVDLTVTRNRAGLVLTPDAAFPPTVKAATQFDSQQLPLVPRESVEVIIKLRPDAWRVYVENKQVAAFPAPFLPPIVLYQPATSVLSGDDGDVRLQKIDTIAFGEDFRKDGNDDDPIGMWEQHTGVWRLHTVAEDVSSEGRRRGRRPESDRSPNFACLEGVGKHAVMTTGHYFYDAYTFEASVRVVAGEMGLVFLHQDDGAFHAFTLEARAAEQDAVLRLCRFSGGKREMLAAAVTEQTQPQWVKLRVTIYQDRVQCYIDNVLVLDHTMVLPPGGPFGFYVNSTVPVRIDDVKVKSNLDQDLGSLKKIRMLVEEERGRFFPKRPFSSLTDGQRAEAVLAPPRASLPQELMIGSIAYTGRVFSATFQAEPGGGSCAAGLISCYTRWTDKPYYRFVREQSRGIETFRLDRVLSNKAVTVTSLKVPLAEGKKNAPFKLMCDASSGHEVRLYRDDELVLVHDLGKTPVGAAGLYVGPMSSVKIRDVAYRHQRQGLYRNQYEKTEAYVDDPYMRHWSSPEGQWVTLPNDQTWYKGDFFGRFLLRMPLVSGSKIQLGVQEGTVDGAAEVHVQGRSVTLGVRRTDGKLDMQTATMARKDIKEFEVHYEGYWVWITERGSSHPLLKQRLDGPFQGRRIRVSGFSTKELGRTYVARYNCKDYLFNESLYDWTVNGGNWQVVNRFHCDPRWSHMNGEAPKGPGAIWSKYTFGGDFCLEFYAGMRHNWYDRSGDFNLTVMSPDTTPSQGYTVTCTGWDRDESQLFTTLYRNGQVWGRSDKYLVPRRRAGNKRRGYMPLLSLGGMRDVHGAWYYIKLRRIGKRLEYYFDNELVFSKEDADLLDEGCMGIWTYLNSIVVARVKMAAERITPRPRTVRRLDLAALPLPEKQVDKRVQAFTEACSGSPVLEQCLPGAWRASDAEGQGRLTWFWEEGVGPYWVMRSTLGGGSMHAKCGLKPVPAMGLLGWRFYVKRTARANFNFHYTVGRSRGQGDYRVERNYFHRLSGTDFDRGRFLRTGRSDVPPVAAATDGWHREGDWVPVDVWLPREALIRAGALAGDKRPLLLRVEGFGNLQAGVEQQGLVGNGPGEAYAIRGMTEIRVDLPMVRATNVVARIAGHQAKGCTDMEVLADWLAAVPGEGLKEVSVDLEGAFGSSQHTVVWVDLPEVPQFDCVWSKEGPGRLDIRNRAAYPDPRLLAARVRLDGRSVRQESVDSMSMRVQVPRNETLTESGSLSVTVQPSGCAASTIVLKTTEQPLADPPVLLRVHGLTPLLETFESRNQDGRSRWRSAQQSVKPDVENRTDYLQIANRGQPERLAAAFSGKFSLASYPVCQFRYRGDPMARISLRISQNKYVALSEEYEKATTTSVRYGKKLILDGSWHTWRGMISDCIRNDKVAMQDLVVDRVQLGSRAKIDQTGAYTRLGMDDLVMGPAVSTAASLAFTPSYYDLDGVSNVWVSVRSGMVLYDELDADAKQKLQWQRFEPEGIVQPSLAELSDGLAQLYIKAEDVAGIESRVTSVPFLLDREAPDVECQLREPEQPGSNHTRLRISSLTGIGSPMAMEKITLRWSGESDVRSVEGSELTRIGSRDLLDINWPMVFHEKLSHVTNGMQADITIDNLCDGAGNQSAAIRVPLSFDFSKDKTPPTVVRSTFPANVLFAALLPGEDVTEIPDVKAQIGETMVEHEEEDEHYLRIRPDVERINASLGFRDRTWTLGRYPFMAFRLRRPLYHDDDTSDISLSVSVRGKRRGKRLLIPLASSNYTAVAWQEHRAEAQDAWGGGGGTHVADLLPIPWKRNTWHPVVLDLRELLRGHVSEEEWDNTTVRGMYLNITGADRAIREPLDIQAFYIFGEWTEDDRVDVVAYDRSGLHGTVSTYEEMPREASVAPAALRRPGDAGGWRMLRVRDNAGNVSKGIPVPMFGTTRKPITQQPAAATVSGAAKREDE